MTEKVTLNGVEYVRADAVPAPRKGSRVVVVVDRGWIFAGDAEDGGSRLVLTRAVLVRRWESIGFSGMLREPKSNKVTLEQMPTSVEIPWGSVIFQNPVADDWGL